MKTAPTSEQLRAALDVTVAVADTIRDLGTVVSGHLYARLMQYMSLETYNMIIGTLKRAGLIKEYSYQLTWIGPTGEDMKKKKIGLSKTRPRNEATPLGTKKEKKGVDKAATAAPPQEVVDTPPEVGVELTHSPIPATLQEKKTMTLTLKSLNKKGTQAYYSGAAVVIRIPLGAFPGKTAASTITVTDDLFVPAKAPKVKLTKEQRKAARAAQPKLTEAEKIVRAEAKLAARKAALATANQPSM